MRSGSLHAKWTLHARSSLHAQWQLHARPTVYAGWLGSETFPELFASQVR